ncbi:MAG: hypothetical protein ACREEY_06115 [Brevundimonas sp.]
MSTSIWRELAISPSTDEREIRRAYARRLKIVHPEDDPEGFQTLRAAFDQAMNHARHAAWSGQDWDEDEAVDEELDAAPPPVATDHAASVSTLDQAPQQDPALVAEIERDRAERAEHQRRCDALSEALRHPTPDDEAVLTALVAVFRSPALGALDVHDSTEHWLGQMAGQRGPGIGVMLEPTITFFGWDHQPVGHHWNPGLGALQHRYDLETIHRLRNPASASHEAFMALSRPMTPRERIRARLSFGVKPRIVELLAKIDADMAYAQAYLNQETVAWWREHLSRPRFDGGAFWTVIGAMILGGFFGWAGADPKGVSTIGLFAGAGVGIAFSGIVILGRHYLIALPRWRIARQHTPLPFWRSGGWGPATAVLLVATALAPAGLSRDAALGLSAVIGLGGLGLAYWAIITIDSETWRMRLHWLWAWPPVALPLWAICGFAIKEHAPFCVALALALVILAIGGVHLSRRWPDQAPKRQWAMGLLAGLAAVSGGLAYISLYFWTAPLALALLVVASAGGILAAPYQSTLATRVRRWATPIGVIIIAMSLMDTPTFRTSLFAWGGAWFGGVLALTTLGDLVRSSLPSPKRRKSADRFA